MHRRLNLTPNPTSLQRLNRCHLQFFLAKSAIYHDLCEMERLSLDRLHVEIVYVNLFTELLRIQNLLASVQLLGLKYRYIAHT